MVWKVIGSPAAARSRRAWMARCRVAWLRWWAAWMRKRVLSGRICGLLLAWFFFLERGDALVEVAGDLPVHLCQARLAAGFGRGGDLQQLLVLLAMLGQELGGGDEHRAGQAGVGVRAALLDRQAAVAVGERLGRPAEPLLGPGRFGERPVGVQGDGLALGVDLAGLFPVAAHGLIVQPGVMGRHGMRVMVQDSPDDLLRHVVVDQPGAQGVAPLMGSEMDRPAVLVADVAAVKPPVKR